MADDGQEKEPQGFQGQLEAPQENRQIEFLSNPPVMQEGDGIFGSSTLGALKNKRQASEAVVMRKAKEASSAGPLVGYGSESDEEE